ncbi:MAG: FAD-binding oxidoreductase [Salinibacter sp.]
MTTSIWQHAHRKRETGYDVIVVGGGIVGCSTAYWLRRQQPSLDVGVVEAGTLGAGASGRNAGFVVQGTDADFLTDIEQYGRRTARRLWHFTRDNRDLLSSELHSTTFEWRSDGSLSVAETEAENQRLQKCVPRLRAAGAPVVHLDAKKTNARLQASGFAGGLFVTTGAVVHPLRLVHHIAAESGADVRTQHPVQELRSEGQGVALRTPHLRLRADQVVLAVGPSLPTVVPSLGRYVRPMRAQMLATRPAETQHVTVPVYAHDGAFYVRQLGDGTVLAGGGRHQHAQAEATATDATTPAVQATIERYLHRHLPWTQSLSVDQRWSGIMGFSPDRRPVVGAIPDVPGSFYATGFTGHGMSYGFRMGRLLADLVCGTTQPDGYDLFSDARFEAAGPASNDEPISRRASERTSPKNRRSSSSQ